MTERIGTPPLGPGDEPAEVVVPTIADHWPDSGLAPVAELADQLPSPGSLEAGQWLAVTAAPRPQKLLGRLLGRPATAGVHAASRCTALLARGYVDVCADADGTAYGRAR